MKTLATQPVGQYLCGQISGPRDAQIRLKRLGICENRPVEIVRHGDPMILNVVGANLGVSRYLAECIMVESVNDPLDRVPTEPDHDSLTSSALA